MICPFCNASLTYTKGEYGYGYECRKYYFYLEKDFPVCHFTFRNYKQKEKTEYRYLFFPFVIYASPEEGKSKVYLLYKNGERSYDHVFDMQYIVPDCQNPEILLDKLNTYLTFL